MDAYDSIDYDPNIPYSDFNYVNEPIRSNVKVGTRHLPNACGNGVTHSRHHEEQPAEQFATQVPTFLKAGLQQRFTPQIPSFLKTGLQQHMTDFDDDSGGGIMMPSERLMLYFIIFVLIISVAVMQMNFTYRMYKLARRTIHESK